MDRRPRGIVPSSSRAPSPGDARQGYRSMACDPITEDSTRASVRPPAWTRTAVLFVLFGTAIAIRVYHITDPLTEFRATRQYRAAMIARAQYQAYDKTMPTWAREVALLNGEQ